jgi:hypothetical protein
MEQNPREIFGGNQRFVFSKRKIMEWCNFPRIRASGLAIERHISSYLGIRTTRQLIAIKYIYNVALDFNCILYIIVSHPCADAELKSEAA